MQIEQIGQNEFYEVVLQEKRPVLVDFYADWCGPCKMLMPILEELAQEVKDQALIVKVNIDQNEELAEQYQVQSVPNVFLFENGKVRDSAVGIQSKKQLQNLLGIESKKRK